ATGAMRSYWTTRGLPAGVHALMRFAGVIMRRVPMRTAILVAIAAGLVARSAGAATGTNLNSSGGGPPAAGGAARPPGRGVSLPPGLTGTITLASPIDVNGLTISGPGASVLRLSGGGATWLLAMTGATTLEGLTIADGLATEEVTGAVTYSFGSGPHVL